jgi:FKBP-type peptidyl-prolyl cis-trans isomerase 2
MSIKNKDFVSLNYVGKLKDGTIFDTTIETIAKENDLYDPKIKLSPAKICVGENQILPGIDESLIGKKVGEKYTLELSPENAFGKKDIKKIKTVSFNTFDNFEQPPRPGLQIEDGMGRIGTIMRVAGGRVTINYNHPLSGKDVVYEIEILEKIEDDTEKVKIYLNNIMKLAEDKINVEVNEGNAKIELPFKLPEEFLKELSDRIKDVCQLKEVNLEGKEPKQ